VSAVSGQYTDPETGLIYLRARYYDPSTGQFLNRDPAVAITRQPYEYAADNPINRIDPTGLYNCLPGTEIGPCPPGAPMVAPPAPPPQQRYTYPVGPGNKDEGGFGIILPSPSLNVTVTNLQVFDFSFGVSLGGPAASVLCALARCFEDRSLREQHVELLQHRRLCDERVRREHKRVFRNEWGGC
jgi:RHS repeat-associated protein